MARLQGREQLGFDLSFEAPSIDRARDHPGRGQPVMAEAGDEGLGIPMSERRMIDQPFSHRRPAGAFHHLGIERCLIDKDQTLQDLCHEGLTPGDPKMPPLRHLRAMAFAGEQSFFYG